MYIQSLKKIQHIYLFGYIFSVQRENERRSQGRFSAFVSAHMQQVIQFLAHTYTNTTTGLNYTPQLNVRLLFPSLAFFMFFIFPIAFYSLSFILPSQISLIFIFSHEKYTLGISKMFPIILVCFLICLVQTENLEIL